MRFHKVKMVGKFILEKLASLPGFSSENDKGRMVYVDTEGSGYIGTPDGWVPIAGIQVVSSLPNWESYHIGRLFFDGDQEKLYIGNSSGFTEVGAASGEISPDYSSVICMQCSPPSASEIEYNDTYVICSSGATDQWAGQEDRITVWDGSSWAFSDPTDYQRIFIECILEYYVWVDSQGQWMEEVQETYFNYTSSDIYPKTLENMPTSASEAFFELDANDDLMTSETPSGYISTVWEKDGPSALMPRLVS